MPKYNILQEGASYTFRSYCEMNAEPEDILSDLGYQLLTARLVLPKTSTVLGWEGELQARLERSLMVVTLTSEMARRESTQSVVVIEAKRDDLTRGFTQLAAGVIAVAQLQELESVYGAVTIGDAWRFGYLDAVNKTITQDIALYRIPDDLTQIVNTLVGILEGP